MSSFSENTPIIINAIVALLGAAGTYLVLKRNQKREDLVTADNVMRVDFDVLIKANNDFRDEVRQDLELAKRELNKAKEELHIAKNRITVLENELGERLERIHTLEIQIATLQGDLRVMAEKNK